MRGRSVVRCLTLSLLLFTTPASGATSPAAQPSRPTPHLLYDEALAAVRAPGFAGVWVAADGALVVSLTRPTATAARAARADVARLFGRPDLMDKRLVTHQARYSFRQLRAWYDAAAADVVAVPGVLRTDVDERANVLRYGVADVAATAPLLRAALARQGVPAAAVAVDAAAPATPTSLSNPARPLVGGVAIGNGLATCSLGFPAVRGGVKGFVTAAHCSRVQGSVDGTVYSQPSGTLPPVAVEIADPPFFAGGACPVGNTPPRVLCRYSDASFNALLDDTHYAQGHIARPPAGSTAWNGVDTFRITSEATPILGETVSKVGKTTGLTSGAVTSTCANIGVTYDFPSRRDVPWRMLCQMGAGYTNSPGDSGSPVFVVTSGNDVALVGVHWNGNSAFSPIANIERTDELGALATCDPGFTCP